jgi:hypothetical protein
MTTNNTDTATNPTAADDLPMLVKWGAPPEYQEKVEAVVRRAMGEIEGFKLEILRDLDFPINFSLRSYEDTVGLLGKVIKGGWGIWGFPTYSLVVKVTATRPMEEWPMQLGYYQSFEQLAATYREVASRPVERGQGPVSADKFEFLIALRGVTLRSGTRTVAVHTETLYRTDYLALLNVDKRRFEPYVLEEFVPHIPYDMQKKAAETFLDLGEDSWYTMRRLVEAAKDESNAILGTWTNFAKTLRMGDMDRALDDRSFLGACHLAGIEGLSASARPYLGWYVRDAVTSAARQILDATLAAADMRETVPAGFYSFGDPCYVIQDPDRDKVGPEGYSWEMVCDKLSHRREVVASLDGPDAHDRPTVFRILSTLHGDGGYGLKGLDTAGQPTEHYLGVDAGLLGVLSLVEGTRKDAGHRALSSKTKELLMAHSGAWLRVPSEDQPDRVVSYQPRPFKFGRYRGKMWLGNKVVHGA